MSIQGIADNLRITLIPTLVANGASLDKDISIASCASTHKRQAVGLNASNAGALVFVAVVHRAIGAVVNHSFGTNAVHSVDEEVKRRLHEVAVLDSNAFDGGGESKLSAGYLGVLVIPVSLADRAIANHHGSKVVASQPSSWTGKNRMTKWEAWLDETLNEYNAWCMV